jgi:type I restriction enzyme S subunit
MTKWNTYKLGEVISQFIDYRGKTPPKVSFGIPLITAKIVKDGAINEPNEFVPEAIYEKWMARGIPEFGDVLLTTEAPLGEAAQLNFKHKVVVGQRLITLRGKKGILENTFLKYSLHTKEMQARLEAVATGTTVIGIKSAELKKVEIDLPDLPTQRRIAEILSALDDKIELNRRMNQTLEQMAKTLFRQYFVDGIDEENLPEGWKSGKLGDVSKNVRKTVNPKELQEECMYVGLEHIPRKSIALTEWSTSGGVESQKYKFEENHILFGKLRPYFHKVVLAPFEGIGSTDILVVEPLKPFMLAFCLLHYSSEEVVQFSNMLSHGTRMPRADWKGLSSYVIAIPPTELLIKFNDLVSPSLNKIRANIEEVQTLTTLRDTLLPKLMSGEIDVTQTQQSALHESVLS